MSVTSEVLFLVSFAGSFSWAFHPPAGAEAAIMEDEGGAAEDDSLALKIRKPGLENEMQNTRGIQNKDKFQ